MEHELVEVKRVGTGLEAVFQIQLRVFNTNDVDLEVKYMGPGDTFFIYILPLGS